MSHPATLLTLDDSIAGAVVQMMTEEQQELCHVAHRYQLSGEAVISR